MKVSLNGLELSRQAADNQTVGDVLSQLSGEIHQGGKIIVAVHVDGQWIPRDESSHLLSKRVGTVQQLDVTVAELADAKEHALDDAEKVIYALKMKSKPTAKKFRVGDDRTANTELAAFLQDLQLVAMSLDYCTRDLKEVSGAAALRRRLDDTARTLVPTLDRLYKAQAAEDYVTVADELEYVLPEHLDQWQGLVRDARQTTQHGA
jgi:hypothetical protein